MTNLSIVLLSLQWLKCLLIQVKKSYFRSLSSCKKSQDTSAPIRRFGSLIIPRSVRLGLLPPPNMKISVLKSTFLFLVFASSCAAITENQIRILFNNGSNAPGMSCSAADMVWVNKSLLFARRNLRQAKGNVNEQQSLLDVDDSSDSGRNLGVVFYPATCKTSCSGFATGTCVAPGCKGYRRELEDTENGRDLQNDEAWCVDAKGRVSTFLGILQALVSSPCWKLLTAPRTMECITVTC
jgi:hypothetical protein